ncbi:MAG: hypothetical protein LAT55_07275 [Opitutales bacterium]|nr:hypothetical protein [Opitutales bacterium]
MSFWTAVWKAADGDGRIHFSTTGATDQSPGQRPGNRGCPPMNEPYKGDIVGRIIRGDSGEIGNGPNAALTGLGFFLYGQHRGVAPAFVL